MQIFSWSVFFFSFLRKYAIMFEWFQILLHTQNGWLSYLRVGTHLGKDVFFYWRLKWIWVHSVLGLEVLSSDPVFFVCFIIVSVFECLSMLPLACVEFGIVWLILFVGILVFCHDWLINDCFIYRFNSLRNILVLFRTRIKSDRIGIVWVFHHLLEEETAIINMPVR